MYSHYYLNLATFRLFTADMTNNAPSEPRVNENSICHPASISDHESQSNERPVLSNIVFFSLLQSFLYDILSALQSNELLKCLYGLYLRNHAKYQCIIVIDHE